MQESLFMWILYDWIIRYFLDFMYNRQVRTTSGKASHRLGKTGVAHLTFSLPDGFD
jgi:hypothetical protein